MTVEITSPPIATPVSVANGGTGTSTQFTQSCIVYAGANGVYSQDYPYLLWDGTNHYMGIGTAASRPLTVTGNLQDGADESFMLVAGTIVSSTHDQYGARFTPGVAPSANSVRTYGGLDLIVVTQDSSLTNYLTGATVFGFRGGLFGFGTGLVGTSIGLDIICFQVAGGSITNSYGVRIEQPAFISGGTVTNAAGLQIAPFTTATNNTHVLIGGVSIPAGTYSIYNQSTAQNYFAGNLGIGSTTITSLFNVGTAAQFQINTSGVINKYNNVSTVGGGVPAIYGSGRSTAQTGAVASVATYTVGAADGSFIVSMNMLITAFTAGTVSGVTTYTDEGGTARSLTMNFSSLGGTLGSTAGAAGAFEGIPLHIRAKASTAITMTTTVNLFTGTYNVEGYITQIG